MDDESACLGVERGRGWQRRQIRVPKHVTAMLLGARCWGNESPATPVAAVEADLLELIRKLLSTG
jgi:hypothetical protein